MITTTSEYAIRAVGYLAMVDPNVRIGSEEISGSTGVPKRFLLKILNTLKNQRIIFANRGIGGGFRLARPPESLTLYDIVTIFENPARHEHCLLGETTCEENSYCPVHERWKGLREQYIKFLTEINFGHFKGSSAFESFIKMMKDKQLR